MMNRLINADTRITDRFIFNEANSIKNALLKQEQNKNRLYKFTTLFKTINKAELISVDTIEACGIDSDCIIRRTKKPLPKIIETSGGYLIRNVSSLDGSSIVYLTTDLSISRKLGSDDPHGKKEQLAFVRNNYLYFINLDWPYARIEALFEDPDEIDMLNNCEDNTDISCSPIYDRKFPIPNYLEDGLKKLLNEALLRYYHQYHDDPKINKSETQ